MHAFFLHDDLAHRMRDILQADHLHQTYEQKLPKPHPHSGFHWSKLVVKRIFCKCNGIGFTSDASKFISMDCSILFPIARNKSYNLPFCVVNTLFPNAISIRFTKRQAVRRVGVCYLRAVRIDLCRAKPGCRIVDPARHIPCIAVTSSRKRSTAKFLSNMISLQAPILSSFRSEPVIENGAPYDMVGNTAFACTYSLIWRWGESNPRPKQLQPNFYACILPLISQGVCQQAGLSPSIRSVIRTSAPERRAPKQVLLSYAAAA